MLFALSTKFCYTFAALKKEYLYLLLAKVNCRVSKG